MASAGSDLTPGSSARNSPSCESKFVFHHCAPVFLSLLFHLHCELLTLHCVTLFFPLALQPTLPHRSRPSPYRKHTDTDKAILKPCQNVACPVICAKNISFQEFHLFSLSKPTISYSLFSCEILHWPKIWIHIPGNCVYSILLRVLIFSTTDPSLFSHLSLLSHEPGSKQTTVHWKRAKLSD